MQETYVVIGNKVKKVKDLTEEEIEFYLEASTEVLRQMLKEIQKEMGLDEESK